MIIIWTMTMLYGASSRVSASSNTFMDYAEGLDRYTVYFIDLKGRFSPAERKNKALKRAAEVAVLEGYHYFQIIEEESVTVSESKDKINAYVEEISSALNPIRIHEGVYPAYKLTILCSQERSQGMIDVSSLTMRE